MEKQKDIKRVIVFDSGIGGLNVLRACVDAYPELRYIYAADNWRVPYGNRSEEEVYSFASGVLDGAMRFDPCAVVIACNTVTADCITELRRRYDVPVIGMQPAVKPAARLGGKCLVMATKATAGSANFKKLVRENFPEAIVYANFGLADYVENNIFNLPEMLPDSLIPVGNFDSIVLGCTHYIFVKNQLKKRYLCHIFDGVDGTVAQLGKILGISDHQCDFSGISDHSTAYWAQVDYYNGNISRNRQVFEQVLGVQR